MDKYPNPTYKSIFNDKKSSIIELIGEKYLLKIENYYQKIFPTQK